MSAGKTYTRIATTTSNSSTIITFNNIPQNYTDIILVISGANSGNMVKRLNFNDDTGNGSATVMLSGYTSTSFLSSNYSFAELGVYGSVASQYVTIAHIMNYSNSSTFKSYLYRESTGMPSTEVGAGTWASTAAITKIQVTSTANNFGTTTKFTLYGIECAKNPKATGGNSVYTDGTYWYHIFNSSGLFVPDTNLSNVDYLVVAGGGSGNTGGGIGGGGGGAGGMRCTVTASGGSPGTVENKLSLTGSTGYAIVVGAGGAVANRFTAGSNGNSSSIGSLVSTTGGGAGSGYWLPSGPNNGGSGGGSSGGSSPTTAAGNGTANEGFGGGSSSGLLYVGGGGGGASAAGSGANGGAGRATSILGTSITYAGGGGGGTNTWQGGASAGTGGAGGGGNGGDRTGSNTGIAGGNGVAGTGGGGGGAAIGPAPQGSGGSGIVIVRYPV